MSFPNPMHLAMLAWRVIFLLWIVAALFDRHASQQTVSQPKPIRSHLHLLFVILAAALLFWPRAAVSPLNYPLFASPILGVALTWLGVAFAGLARLALGANWSSGPRIRDQHTLTIEGPYRIVRHPIYSGMLLAFLGTAIVLGQLRGYLAVLIVFITWLIKSLAEDCLLAAQFGPQFEAYRERTKALIPGLL